MTRTVVITGGGTGIGKAVAASFAEAGDRVVITGRRRDVLENSLGVLRGNITLACFDATNPEEVESFASTLGSLDVLVNNAGAQMDLDRAASGSLASLAQGWRSNFEANVMPTILMTAAFENKLNSAGSVITIGSIAADQGSGSYGAAKAAIASWNVGLAKTLGPRGATANVVAPGYIADTEFFRDKMSPNRRSALIAATLTGRAGLPNDIAATTYFLASRGARQITGQVISVNGGARTTR